MIQSEPPNPTSSDDVVISATFSGCIVSYGMVQSGFAFAGHIDYGDLCFATPPGGTFPFPVGKLAPGNYTVTVQTDFASGGVLTTETGAFSVSGQGAPFATPTTEPLGIALMAVLILLAAIPHLVRRQTRSACNRKRRPHYAGG